MKKNKHALEFVVVSILFVCGASGVVSKKPISKNDEIKKHKIELLKARHQKAHEAYLSKGGKTTAEKLNAVSDAVLVTHDLRENLLEAEHEGGPQVLTLISYMQKALDSHARDIKNLINKANKELQVLKRKNVKKNEAAINALQAALKKAKVAISEELLDESEAKLAQAKNKKPLDSNLIAQLTAEVNRRQSYINEKEAQAKLRKSQDALHVTAKVSKSVMSKYDSKN